MPTNNNPFPRRTEPAPSRGSHAALDHQKLRQLNKGDELEVTLDGGQTRRGTVDDLAVSHSLLWIRLHEPIERKLFHVDDLTQLRVIHSMD